MGIFHKTSEHIFSWQAKQPHVKEESLTDWLLYYLSENDCRIKYLSFSRNEEATIGVDWEWWVIVDDKYYSFEAYRFLVQAKKLRPQVDNYSSLSYSNKNGLQIDLLLREAQNRRAFPLYMFYSTAVADDDAQIKVFPQITDALEWCRGCKNGAYLSPAETVNDFVFSLPKRKITDEELVNNSVKFSIFDYDMVHGFRKFLSSFDNKSLNIKYSAKDIPRYLETMLGFEADDEQKHYKHWLEKEYRDIKGLAGIAIIDLRKKDET